MPVPKCKTHFRLRTKVVFHPGFPTNFGSNILHVIYNRFNLIRREK